MLLRNEQPIRDRTIMGNMLDGLRRVIVTFIDYGMNSNRSMSDREYIEEIIRLPDDLILFSTVDENPIEVERRVKTIRKELPEIKANPVDESKRFYFSNVIVKKKEVIFTVKRGDIQHTISIRNISKKDNIMMLVDAKYKHHVESLDLIGDVIYNRVKELFNL